MKTLHEILKIFERFETDLLIHLIVIQFRYYL